MYRSPDIHKQPDRGGRRILIVDDEPTLRFGFAYALTDDNTVAETASNGAEALERLEEVAYDAVVLDLRMPEIDGIAVIEGMRAKGVQTPVILCSAFITLHSALLAIRNQVVDFLMKPVKPQELREAVAGVLGQDVSPLGTALSAMRRDELDKAIGILETHRPDMGASEKAWLEVLTSLRSHQLDVQHAESELDGPLIDFLVVHGEH